MENSNRRKLVVVGSTNTDMVIHAPHFPIPGETVIGDDFMTNFGGKGANQAVAAARLGIQTVFVGKVGSDKFGKETIAHLKKEGVDVNYLFTSAEKPSGVALITTVDGGENTIVVNSGANFDLKEEDIEKAKGAFKDASIVLMQLETPIRTLIAAANLAKSYGCLVVLNPAPAPNGQLPQELLQKIDLIIPNKTEASAISGCKITDAETASKAIGIIQKMGVKSVIITVGSKGAIAMVDGELLLIPAIKVKAVDTTGAGDTFCGALCAALINGSDMHSALAFANKASSISVTRSGAQISMPFLSEI
ncbi:MAG: ribokinase [Segatella salivae]